MQKFLESIATWIILISVIVPPVIYGYNFWWENDQKLAESLFLSLFFVITLGAMSAHRAWIMKHIEDDMISLDEEMTHVSENTDIQDILHHLEMLEIIAGRIIASQKSIYIRILDRFMTSPISANLSSRLYRLLHVLRSLQKDLITKIDTKKKIVLQAQDGLSQLQWNTSLIDDSELQQARLERQIEQFEELQKVLVKI